jgi:serine/threonine-protein kinase
MTEPPIPRTAAARPKEGAELSALATPAAAAGELARSPRHAAVAAMLTRIAEHKVGQWLLAYAAFAYGCLHAVEMLSDAFEWPKFVARVTTVVLLIGMPITVLLAWYLRPPGRSGTAHAHAAAPAAVVVEAPPHKSIAVLPFVDMSELKDQEYFSDGLTEELIGLLTRVPELRVPARTSCFFFKGKQATIAEIAHALHVAHLLEGSVRKAGNTVRITAQLVQVDNGYHLWSQTYDRTLDDIFRVQDEIAGAVVRSLQVTLLHTSLPARAAQPSAEAYQLYLRGRFHWNRRSAEDFRKGIKFFQQAIAVDPGYALAFTGLADCYSLLPIYDRKTIATETMPQAKAAAVQALSIDDNLAEAHASLGLILGIFEFDWQAAEREQLRAIELNPNTPMPHLWYGQLLVNLGRFEAGLAESRLAVSLDPLSLAANLALGIALNSARRFDEAVAQLHKTLELGRKFADTNYFLFEAYANQKLYKEAVAVYVRQKQLDGESAAQLEAIKESYAKGSWQGFLQHRISVLEAHQQIVPEELASFYARLGDPNQAMTWLERSYASRSPRLTHLKVDARYDNLRADPRFKDLLHRVGLAA